MSDFYVISILVSGATNLFLFFYTTCLKRKIHCLSAENEKIRFLHQYLAEQNKKMGDFLTDKQIEMVNSEIFAEARKRREKIKEKILEKYSSLIKQEV